MAISAPMSARLRASAPIIINILVLLYGASFTLTLTVFQSFATAGLASVKEGWAALRRSGAQNPAAFQTIFGGLYAGGFAALTVLRNEAAAAVAIGVDMGKRVGGLLDSSFLARDTSGTGAAAEPEELAPMGDSGEDTPAALRRTKTTEAAPTDWRRRWAAAVLLGVSVSAFVLLALLYVRPVRIASLCVLAAQALVNHAVPLLGEGTSSRLGKATLARGALVAAVAGVGIAVQAALYLADANSWTLPNGSAIPYPLRLLLSAPLAVENALEEVRLACKCDLGRLQGLATEKLGVDAGAYGFTSLQ